MKRVLRKGISPVIATVLLVAIVIIIALIVFLWFKAMGEEVITKFGKNVELSCGDVEFLAEYSNGELIISNTGNVPIFGIKVTAEGAGSEKNYDLKNNLAPEWPDLGLNPGGIFSADIGIEIGSAEKIILTPVLMGTSDRGERIYICKGDMYTSEIII